MNSLNSKIAAARKTYETYWESYQKGDLETFASTLDDNFEMIGTSESEICHSKADGIEFLKAQMHEVVGKVEMRNRKIDVVPIDQLMLVNEQCDIYVLVGMDMSADKHGLPADRQDWNFYSKIRISTFLRETEYGWKVTQQHGSLPDMRVQKGETIALEKISKENLELRDAVKRRTAELENKNRELAIEAALEKVRAQTMAMHSSEDVGKCVVKMLSELTALGVDEGTRFGIGILNHDNENNQLWTARKDGEEVNMHIGNIDMASHPLLKSARKAWKEQFPLHRYVLEGEDLLNYYQMLNNAPDYKILVPIEKLPEREFHYGFVFENGFFYAFSPREFQPDLIHITKRFSSLFEQTYRRYLDLVRAEAQARESQIEAALEKVRSRSLAMHKSDELNEVVSVLFEKLKELQIPFTAVGIATNIEASKDLNAFVCGQNEAGLVITNYRLPYFDNQIPKDLYSAIEEQLDYFVGHYSKEEKDSFYEYVIEHTAEFSHLPEDIKRMIFDSPTYSISMVAVKNAMFNINDFEGKILAEHEIDIIKRFARVFDQAYIRFLDLQKAEAQAREAQIELALERVRAKAMAMQGPAHFLEVIKVMGEQFIHLDFDIEWVNFGANGLDVSNGIDTWNFAVIPGGKPISSRFFIPYFDHSLFLEAVENLDNYRRTGHDFFEMSCGKEDKDRWLDHLYANTIFKDIPEEFKAIQYAKPGYTTSNIALKDTWLSIGKFDIRSFTEEQHAILRRFGNAFGQAYTRFLDLQKAEAQAREAQIEAALERVRSRSMAMHKSDELLEAGEILFLEMIKLGIESLTAGYVLIDQEEKNGLNYTPHPGTKKIMPVPVIIPHNETSQMQQVVENWKKGNPFFIVEMDEEETIKHQTFIAERSTNFPLTAAQLIAISPAKLLLHNFYFKEGYVLIVGGAKLSAEQTDIMLRFAKVFQQTYTRFLDLQKAEAQAHEAQIEAALEKVRSRAMAMHSSNELKEVARELRTQLGKLGQRDLETCAIHLYEESPTYFHSWAAVRPPHFDGEIIESEVFFPKDGGQLVDEMLTAYFSKQKEYVLLVDGEKAEGWFDLLREHFPEAVDLILESRMNAESSPKREKVFYFSFADFHGGSLVMVTYESPDVESRSLLARFANVFGIAYRRFSDLQKAEAQAREATKQASLDRVRGVIASMRSAADLELITPLVFKELTILGVPFIRCGIFIIDEKRDLVNAYLSSPEGDSLGVFKLPFNASELTQGTVEAWRKGEVYRRHWNKEDFIHWINNMIQQDQIQDSRTYQGAAVPPESLDLHFVPFTQGMLYVGAVSPLDEKELELAMSLAKAFSIAYARYEDFIKLEQAKAGVESAMSELRATQSQLIQQEKLASLGQLTAGIAHEIKNPLNFVNNFSEVSIEMIEEALVEMEKRESRDETLIRENLEDIKSNLQKVHEHGSRANSIVTSMLQHSRGGSGKMEPTDLNALIKEYVNLSFHGMRAGKNPINVDIVLDLNPDLGMVSLIKEDFTRVVINLCNNAFDACAERSRSTMREKVNKYEVRSTKYEDGVVVDGNYVPKLKVTTRLENGQVLIAFEDNGPGISDEIKDKILQPFFTTKKGTEGTGLGLSITHDIVKAHGGEIKVTSKLGEGSTFLIELPNI